MHAHYVDPNVTHNERAQEDDDNIEYHDDDADVDDWHEGHLSKDKGRGNNSRDCNSRDNNSRGKKSRSRSRSKNRGSPDYVRKEHMKRRDDRLPKQSLIDSRDSELRRDHMNE